MRVLTFRVWAPYAHFRRPYTTRSPATFSVPPRPTVLGLIGAILGLSKREYPEILQDIRVGVRLDTEIRKIRTIINLLDTKENKMIQRTQMLYEFISEPKYTLALFSQDNELLNRVYTAIRERAPYYTPYLGTAQHIARIYEPKIEECAPVDEVKTLYVAPIDAVMGAEAERTYIVERQAYYIDAERRATKYVDIAIPIGGTITVVRTEEVIVTDGGHVLW